MNKKPKPSEIRNVAKFENVAESVDKFEVTEDVAALAGRFGLNLTDTRETRFDRAAQNMNRSMHCMIAAGLDLASLQAECEHGEFLTFIEERGFGKDAVYRAISYTRFLLSRAKDERERLLAMPKSKVLALASADAAVIDDLLADGEYGDLNNMSVRGLRARIRELEEEASKRTVRLEAELEHRDAVIAKLKKKDVHREFDPLTHMVRDECLAYQGGIEINVQSLQALFEEVVKQGQEVPEWDLRLQQIWFAVHAIASRAVGLLNTVRDAMPIDAPEHATTPNMLTPDEVLRWTLEWETMVSQAKVAAATRADLRAQEGPRGVGRPKGAKTSKTPKGGKA